MTAQEYVAAQTVAWTYEKPKHGLAKCMLLTVGGILVTGTWIGEVGEHYLAWAPMLKRDKQKERELLETVRAKRQAFKEMFHD
jgi:homospermidine synthase